MQTSIMSKILINLITIIFIGSNLAFAQSKLATYRYHSILDGLAANNISDMIKDDYGFVWLAGQNGLNRFDGNNFIVFNNTNIADFFSDNCISKLYTNGKIIYLLSKQEGLIELEPLKLSFKKISDRGIVAMHQNNDVNAYLYSDGFLEVVKGKSPALKKLLRYGSKDDIVIHKNKVYVSSYHTGIYEHNLTDLNQKRVFHEEKKWVIFYTHRRCMELFLIWAIS